MIEGEQNFTWSLEEMSFRISIHEDTNLNLNHYAQLCL